MYDSDSTVQQHQLHDMKEDASIFATDIGISCNFNINKPLQNTTHESNQAPKAQPHNSFHIHTKHKYRDILATLTSTITTSILVTHYPLEINTLLFYNKNYKTHTGVYMILSQLRHTISHKIWT